MSTPATIRETLRAADIPRSWQVELPESPETTVEVAITPLLPAPAVSPKRFLGAGRGLFASAAEIDSYIRGCRDVWEG
jgi:hypothetical protein